jgi:septum formation protein
LYFVEGKTRNGYNRYEVVMKEIVLASASPRRSDLLKQIGIKFKVLPSNVEETFELHLTPEEAVQKLACKKALDIAGKLRDGTLVIGADTVVVKDGILGKPKNEAEACKMLSNLSGQWHEVITGVALVDSLSLCSVKTFEKTRVKFRTLTNDIIEAYIKTGEPMDKAGAYGIQGIGAVLVEKIEGCYFNVVGLPLAKLGGLLESFGVNTL